MKYSDFVKKMEKEYPDWHDLHTALRAGGLAAWDFLGNYVGFQFGHLEPEEVVWMIDHDHALELRAIAIRYAFARKIRVAMAEIDAKPEDAKI